MGITLPILNVAQKPRKNLGYIAFRIYLMTYNMKQFSRLSISHIKINLTVLEGIWAAANEDQADLHAIGANNLMKAVTKLIMWQ